MGRTFRRADPDDDRAHVNFVACDLAGAFVIEPERHADERGFFARTFSVDAFRAHGLDDRIDQCSLSWNTRRATLRGLHYQAEPHGETKLVRCTQGAIYDVIVDLRPDSPTYTRWFAVELSAANRKLHYIPRGLAHGFLTLTDDCEIAYQISSPYYAASARGVRWNDPAFSISWPEAPRVIAARDQSYPDFVASKRAD